ncbi:testis-expressed protein 2-like isoform X2 [Syngnathoides biaculeatus]|uniref:testis-expressed protein 2-like isoform X2 n=1 Tax=Syngnathoides biaculeatus TaxID=300417 RepID=UPI002ADE7F3C|nr:testis-expressed protein 2-like isoform X2 [Syngnathoides biaculeatus]
MSDGRGGGLRADAPPSRQAPGPKLQVQRSLSRDTITIHFSAQGKEEDEEEEEEELYGADAGALEGFRPKETLFFESRTTTGAPGANAASCAVTILPTFGGPRPSSTPPTSSSWPSERPLANPPPTSSGSSSPCKSAGLSSSGPFLSLVRSSSNDAEAREPAPPSHARHRHLMKSFVKSLSADSSKAERQDGSVHQVVHHAPPQQQAQACQRPPPRNMQLLKQFSQPRLYTAPAVAGQVGGDSKTAPSSPTTSPDGRSFFKVQEVEAKIEDTRRRLSEVMSDPLQLFTKLMGEESSAGSAGSGAHRARLLSSSALELSGIPAVNGHSEGYDYSIKEEDGAEGEEDEETPTCGGPDSVFFSFPSLTPAPASAFARSPSLTLGRCSMSALVARQEDDDDFCELYSEDFDLATDTDAPNGDRPGSPGVATGITGLWTELDVEEEEEEEEEGADAVPWMGLVCLTQLLYCYFVLPLPAYVSAVVRGIFAGFALAVVVLWLSGPRKQRRGVEPWNVARLHIKEPDVVKGWMNEIHSYDPELYHATLTHSVYVRLEGSVLRLSKPNRNISRRAAHNEPKPDVTYISQKIYDLSDGKIYLMPHGLARKRVWNKKYPICIELAKQDDFMSNARAGKPQAEAAERAERGDAGLEKDDASAEEQKKPTPGGGDLTIYLFGRTGREKEEWFRRFLLASQLKSNGRGAALPKSAGRPPHTRGHEADSGSGGRGSSDEPRPRDGSSAPSCCSARREMTSDYHLYMAEYVKPPPAPAGPSADGSPGRSPDGSPQTTRKMPETSGNPAEAWLNAFLGRIFWDFLREKYWADIVSKKIQMKLSKIRVGGCLLPRFSIHFEFLFGFGVNAILDAVPSPDSTNVAARFHPSSLLPVCLLATNQRRAPVTLANVATTAKR